MRIISIDGPYNFDFVLNRLALDPLHKVDREERSIDVPIVLNENSYVVKVQAVGTTNEPIFQIHGLKGEKEEALLTEIRRILQWDIPLHAINEHFQQTNLKALFDIHFGTPLILDFHPYNCIIKCIIHQQLNLKFAYTLTHRFVTTYGYKIDDVWFYPRPETVANLTVAELRDLQFSTRKAEYIIDLSKEIVKGNLDMDSLFMKTDEEIMKELITYRGIGQWTIQNLLLFGLGRSNLFPQADIGIQNALKKLLQLQSKPTKEEMEQMIPAWHPYLSYASLYLWRSIE